MQTFAKSVAVWVLLCACLGLRAEKAADLPEPTSYVNDFAHVITAADAQKIEDLNRALHDQANARVVVVTVNTLDDGQGGTETKEEFAAALEEKWKLGKKGEDRSALLLFVRNPPKRWIEVGYGLEGDLNDARVGEILDAGNDPERAGNFSQAIAIEDQGLADVIAKAANIVLTPVVHTYHRQAAPPQTIGASQVVIGILLVLLFLFLLKTGNLGWAFLLLNMFMGGGGGGGGGGGDDRDGGSFNEGGGSGGGGAGRDF